jgi:hypothetical protein
MSFGTIMYYALWPLVAIALVTFWIFQLSTLVMNIGVEYIRGMHDDIKEM